MRVVQDVAADNIVENDCEAQQGKRTARDLFYFFIYLNDLFQKKILPL